MEVLQVTLVFIIIFSHYTYNGFTKSDYNDIYSTGNFASYNGGAISDLATWKSTTGTDKNSMSVDPSFFAVDDLHTKKGNFNGRAKVIGRIHRDIDNDPRDPSTPDIGADEFTPPANDVGVDSIITPYGTTCGDSNTVVTIQVGNFGSASQSNIPVYVVINGGTPISGTLTGPLAAGKDSAYSFKTTINTFAGGTYTIKAYTALKGDVDSTNDTIRTTVLFNVPSTVLSSKGVISCTPGSYKLAAKVSSSKDTIYWYSAAIGGKLLATGDTFKTPTISVPTTYYAQADAKRKNAGLANTGSGGATVNHTYFTRGLYFDAINDFILDTITVYPDKSGTLVVNVYDNGGTLIYSKSVPVKPTKAYGPAKAGLGFAITTGTGYYIEATGSVGFTYLKGNTTATKIKYPMYGGNLVAITGPYNAITGTDYYFFYNWQVSNYAGCPSNRVAVTANIGGTKAGFGYISSCATNTVAFTDSSVYSVGKFASRKWDFGDTKTDTSKNPVHKYASSATYKVKLTITSSTGCTDTAVKYISFGTAPKASFTFTDVCIGSANSYTDNTSFGGKYTSLWRFGIEDYYGMLFRSFELFI
ncbi:MAG: PKD domain-containing protein [Bacteroidetes bacterium]|nr:PKD domain-containing protein [Bacteroidota bacterium]